MWTKSWFFLLVPYLIFAEITESNGKAEIYRLSKRPKIKMYSNLIDQYLYQKPDSALKYARLRLDLATALNDSNEIAQSYYLYSIICNLNGDYQGALNNMKKATIYFVLLDDTVWTPHSFLGLGNYYLNICNLDSSEKYLKRSLELFINSNKSDGIIQSYIGLSKLNLTLANYHKSLEYVFKGLYYSNNVENEKYLCYLYCQAGFVYYDLSDFSKAYENFKKSFLFAKSQNLVYDIALLYDAYSKIKLQDSKIDSALYYAKYALTIFEEIRNIPWIAIVKITLGDIHTTMGIYDTAFSNYREAFLLADRLKNKWLISKSSQKLGQYYLLKENFHLAYNYIDISFKLAKQLGARDLIQNNYKELSDYYSLTGSYKKACNYQVRYTKLRDSLFVQNQNDITNLQVNYFTEKIRKEKELLEREKELYRLAVAKQQVTKSRLLIGLLVVMMISIIGFYLNWQKKHLNKILQKRVDDALKKQKEQQQIIVHQASLSSLGELTASLAHEISQPLQNVNLNSELMVTELIKSDQIDQTIKQCALEIYEDSQRLKEIIEHIRLFSSRQRESVYIKFSIISSVEDALRLLHSQYKKLGIVFKMKHNDNPCYTIGNPYRFEQVVLNLLSNAKDALLEKEKTPNNGFEKTIEISSYINDSSIYLEISDNGIGINDEVKVNLFNPFFSTKPLGVGQGLGLSIAKRIITEMNGNISFQSDYLLGTTMQIKLPAYRDKKNELG